MKKFTIVIFLLVAFILNGCDNTNSEKVGGNGFLTGDKPPNAYIVIDNKKYNAKLGTYCWQSNGIGTCVDTAGPVELLKGKEPIQVEAGKNITFKIDFSPKPNKTHIVKINNGKESEVAVNENRFTAPYETGIYYYSYGIWWMDKKDKSMSHGDTFYSFVIEIK